MSFKVIVE